MPVTEEQAAEIIERLEKGGDGPYDYRKNPIEKYEDICKDMGISKHDSDEWKETHGDEIYGFDQYCLFVKENDIDTKDMHWVRVRAPGGRARVIEKNKKAPKEKKDKEKNKNG